MAKKNYALAVGRTLFVDDEDGLKVLPGTVVSLDVNQAAFRTQEAIRHGHLVESDEKPSSKKEEK